MTEYHHRGCQHIVESSKNPDDEPAVEMYNDNDPHYCQYMLSREEVDTLITKLKKARDEVFGK